MLFARTTLILSIVSGSIPGLLVFAGTTWAQEAPRSYVASPDIYKVVAQNDQYVVIVGTWAPGQRDILHSHPAGGGYYLTNCKLRNTLADGRARESEPKAGSGFTFPPVAHHVQNIGDSECKMVIVEQK